MPYAKLSLAEVNRLEGEYKVLSDSLPTLAGTPKAQAEKTMKTKAQLAATRLDTAMVGATRYFNLHHKKAEDLNRAAQAALHAAQTAAVAYRKTPSNAALQATVNSEVQKIVQAKADYDQDSLDYGNAWGDFRAYNPTHLPKDAVDDFKVHRLHLVNSQQGTVVLNNQIVAALHQAEALKSITAKATMKADIKSGAGNQRAPTDARQSAAAVAKQLADSLKELKTPTNLTNKPESIKSAATGLASFVKTPPKNWSELLQARGLWAGADSAYKSMVARSAGMEKILATQTRGFRSNELSDKTVKAELAKAVASVKAAKTLAKSYDKDYATARKLMDKIEVQAVKDAIH